MCRLGLRFSSTEIEQEYIASREPSAKNFLKILCAITLFFTIYSIINTVRQNHAFVGYFMPCCFIISLILLRYNRYFKKIMDEALVILCLLLYGFSLYYVKELLERNTIFFAFYAGYGFCMYRKLVEGKIIKLHCHLIMYAGFFGLSLYFIESVNVGILLIQIFMEFVLLLANLDRERCTRRMFGLLYDDKQDLLKFKHLITSSIPTNILILDKALNKILFVNDASQTLLQCEKINQTKKLLQSFLIDPESIENPSGYTTSQTLKSLQLLNLLQALEDFSELGSYDKQKILTFTVRSANKELQDEVYQAKILGLQWDNQEAIALMLNDLTYQETILKLKLADKQKDKVIATVSHELRTPINAIQGLIGIIEKMVTDSKVLFHLSACKYSSDLLLNIVNSILDMSQIRANCIKMSPTSVNLYEVLDEIQRMFHFQCVQKGLELEFDLAPDLPRLIYTDKNRFSQIVINLLNNALKFTFEGQITLRAENNPEDNSKISFYIIDTGIGIKEEDMNKLGKMFGRIDHTEASLNTQGVGLGLTITNELVKLLDPYNQDAKILIDSNGMKGSTFSFSIAKRLNANQSNAINIASVDELSIYEEDHHSQPYNETYKFLSVAKRKTTGSPVSRKVTVDEIKSPSNKTGLRKVSSSTDIQHISKPITHLFADKGWNTHRQGIPSSAKSGSSNLLSSSQVNPNGYKPWSILVDDNPFNLMVAKHILEEKGYQVKTALNGKEAIKVVEEHFKQGETIKFILMDCQMPIMDGFEASSVLVGMMEREVIPRVPIIALSANNSEHDLEMARKSGMCGFLVKPLEKEQLRKVLASNAK